MSFWTAVVVIVAIVAIANVKIARMYSRGDTSRRHFGPFAHFNHRAAPQDDQAALPSTHEKELEREVESLRERIKVLERIATDEHKPQRLAAEIESLRDK